MKTSLFFNLLFEEAQKPLAWWVYLLIILAIIVLIWLFWKYFLRDQGKEAPPPAVKTQSSIEIKTGSVDVVTPPAAEVEPPQVVTPPAIKVELPEVTPPAAKVEHPQVVTPAAVKAELVQVTAPAASYKPDDLVIIEGIGPKIAALLKSVGIDSFKKLAEVDMTFLRKTLDDAGLRFIDPGTWAEQAKLAAEGKTQALKDLQDSLKGGRRA